MNTGDLFISLAKQAGIDTEKNEDFLKIMANKDLATADFPDALASDIQKNLLTFESAKNNSDLHSHFMAQALNAVDQRLDEYVPKYELGDEFSQKLKDTQGSYKKMDLVLEQLNSNHIAKLEAAKTNTDDPKLKETIQSHIEEINGLKGKLSGMTDTHVEITEMNEMRDGYEELILNGKVNSLLSNFNYANDTIDKSVNVITAQTLVDQALITKGVKFVNDNGNIVLQTNDGMEYFNAENQKVDTKIFLDTVMSDHKLLKTSETPSPTKTIPPPLVVSGNETPGMADFMSGLEVQTEQTVNQLII